MRASPVLSKDARCKQYCYPTLLFPGFSVLEVFDSRIIPYQYV